MFIGIIIAIFFNRLLKLFRYCILSLRHKWLKKLIKCHIFSLQLQQCFIAVYRNGFLLFAKISFEQLCGQTMLFIFLPQLLSDKSKSRKSQDIWPRTTQQLIFFVISKIYLICCYSYLIKNIQIYKAMTLCIISVLTTLLTISLALNVDSEGFPLQVEKDYPSFILNSYKASSAGLQYQYALKDETKNSYKVYIKIGFNHNQIQSLSFDQQISIAKIYRNSNGFLVIQADYKKEMNFPIILTVTLGNTGTQPFVELTVLAENNLSLKSYSQSTYVLAAAVKYFCFALSLVSLLLLFAGYFGGKLIVLEHLAVLQLIALCQLSVHDASPTFAGLRSLQLSLGFTPLVPYDYSSAVSREFKGSSYSSDLLSNLNFALLLVVVPPLAGITCKILSLTLCKQKAVLVKVYPLLFGENTFFGLVACSYAVFSLLIFDLMIISKKQFNSQGNSYLGVSTISIFALLFLVFCYLLNRFPFYFGDFKRKFEKYNICTYFYNFVLLEKLVSSLLIILFRDITFGLVFQVMIICSQLAFVAIRNPYICGDYRRPLINLSIAAICVFIIFLTNVLPSVQQMQLYAPIVICFLLSALLCSNLYYQIKELLIRRKQARESPKGKQAENVFDGIINYENKTEIRQKQRFHIQQFRRQFIDDHEEAILTSQGHNFTYTSKRKLSQKWNEYALISTKRKVVQQKLIRADNLANDDL